MAMTQPASRPELPELRSVEKPTLAPLPPAHRMSWKGRVFAALFVVAVAAITVGSLVPKPAQPLQVETALSRRGSITRIVTAGGKLQAATEVKLSSSITGDLLTLVVKEGDVVKQGQPLGTIDSRRYAAQVAQSEAARASAHADLQQVRVQVAQLTEEAKRVERLAAAAVASAAEVDKIRAELLGGQARLEAAQGRLAQTDASLREAKHYHSMTTLTSPIDGVVTKRIKQVGERVRGSDFSEDVILVISTLSQMEMKMEVGEQEVVFLKEGDPAEVEVDALPNRKFPAKVVEVARNANVKNAGTEGEVTTFFVRLTLDERSPSALPGMSAQASVFTETHDNAVVVPMQAVTVRTNRELAPKEESGSADEAGPAAQRKGKRDPMQQVVFVMEEGVAKIRRVETGLASETEIEIVSGLKEGERVIEGPYRVLSKDLSDGRAVAEQRAPASGKAEAKE